MTFVGDGDVKWYMSVIWQWFEFGSDFTVIQCIHQWFDSIACTCTYITVLLAYRWFDSITCITVLLAYQWFERNFSYSQWFDGYITFWFVCQWFDSVI